VIQYVLHRPSSLGGQSDCGRNETEERDKREKWREHSVEGGERHLVVGSSRGGRPRWISTWLSHEDEQIGPTK
jgi:hypothetical protein